MGALSQNTELTKQDTVLLFDHCLEDSGQKDSKRNAIEKREQCAAQNVSIKKKLYIVS